MQYILYKVNLWEAYRDKEVSRVPYLEFRQYVLRHLEGLAECLAVHLQADVPVA
jgi:hypothetical protein